MTTTATPGLAPSGQTRKPSIHDPVFPVHPFAGVLAVAEEQDWADAKLFPSFQRQHMAAERAPYCSYVEARESLQQALRRHRGLELALLSGARKALPHMGAMSLGLMSQATLGEALRFGTRYQLIAGSMLQVQLEQNEREAWIVADALFDDPEMQPFLAIDHLATALNAIRQILGLPPGRRLIKRLELAFEAPSLASGLADLFDAPVRFGQAQSRMVFDSAALDLRLSFHNRSSAEISRQACERELAALGLIDGRGDLREQLFDSQGRLRSLSAVADSMGLSLRTLHRALAREGIRYSELAEQQQRVRAEHLLRRGLPTSAVAEELQFSDPRSFVRAFERWTGQSPAAWRRQQQG
ncbi:AraC family transcriptional regulator [Roseateles microcysteis]|uniref:AraC family transcriptional regulator n=1 Tax=Roseateles microcysteis TaxID=3119057 RepID=UPI002FE5A810